MFNIKVTRFDHPQVYYDIQLSLPETVKEKMADYDKFFALLYKLGDSLFGEDKKSAFLPSELFIVFWKRMRQIG